MNSENKNLFLTIIVPIIILVTLIVLLQLSRSLWNGTKEEITIVEQREWGKI